MPEGDTIHRLAARLEDALPGERVRYAWSRSQGEIAKVVGESVVGAEARGKHLLLTLTGGWTFRVHLGIGGRCRAKPWRDEPPPVTWATLILDTEGHRTLVWKTNRADLLRTAHVRAASGLRHLGPDLLAESCDMAEVMRRARATGNRKREIGVLLQDQRVAAGIGNVIRCEAMFLAGVNPWASVAELDDDTLRDCFEQSQKILERGVRTGRRDTTRVDGERYFVYRRTGRPCHRCRTRVTTRGQGELARATYHCPHCQATASGAKR